MKIGLLAYNSANNFGALLQLLSTYMYLKNHGVEPIVINYSPLDLEDYYRKTTPIDQFEINVSFRSKFWKESSLCRDSIDVARTIEKEGIEAVIIGSDAVLQHHALLERIKFPTRNIISFKKFTSDRLFPNPFWGDFEKYLEKQVPLVMMSASSQNSDYNYFSKGVISQMKSNLTNFCYISVRDTWTQKMVSHITNGEVIPPITPDPVFAFDHNLEGLLPTQEEIRNKFKIEGDYFVFSFHNGMITKDWLGSFLDFCHDKGYNCYNLPFANKPSFGDSARNIAFPLSPIDWYSLIKYSKGYFGNNMHPIVIALSNSVPFFSFDNYGRSFFNRYYVDEKSSKIYDVIKDANLTNYRVGCFVRNFTPPSVEFVYDKLVHFDYENANQFANRQLERYKKMMSNVLTYINNEN